MEKIGGAQNVVDIISYSMLSCILSQRMRSENIVTIVEPGRCNNSTNKSILDVLKAIFNCDLEGNNTRNCQIWSEEKCTNGACRVKVNNRADATKNTTEEM